MGLDMHLTRKYTGPHHAYRNITGKVELYWRKANQIHAWFVANVQGGDDDCREYDVTSEQLTELRGLCRQVLKTKNTNLLPPYEGFFFGSTEIDEHYFKVLRKTEQALTETLNEHPDAEYSYRSSW